jgi:hypothetical protein
MSQDTSHPEPETVSKLPKQNSHGDETVPNIRTAPISPANIGIIPSWPPTQDYRKSSRFPTGVTVLLLALAILLIIAGFTFIIYTSNVQYRQSLKAVATTEIQSTKNVLSTTQAQMQGTTNALNAAQANVAATTTSQANDSATATATVDSVTATAGALGDLYNQSTSGTPVLDDTLSDNTGKEQWEGGSSPILTGCAFVNSEYHVSEAQQGNFQPCFAHATQYSNIVYQISITFNKGNRAQGGLLFRADLTKSTYYFFHIGTDGSYAFDLYGRNNRASTLTSGLSTTIIPGFGQANQVAVIASGNHYYLYINQQYVDTVTDNTFTTGRIGVAVINVSTPADATFSNAQVWKL